MSPAAIARRPSVPIDYIDVAAYKIPTPQPETDGTAEWPATMLVLVTVHADGVRGTGWTYGSPAIVTVISEHLMPIVRRADVHAVRATWLQMARAMRNQGRSGIASYAIGAVDTALWDLRARLLDVPLCDLFGRARESVPVYGSGGFTSYDLDMLQAQVGEWSAARRIAR